MKKTILSVAYFLIILNSPIIYANTLDPISHSLQETKQQLNELQQANQQQWLKQHQFQSQETASSSDEDLSKVCLSYHSVRFVGFTLIDPTLYSPVIGECLNETRLNQLQQDITQAYLEKGYIHNPLQFEDDGGTTLQLRVNEGRIAKLSSNIENTNWKQLLPSHIGQPLRVQDLDQALDQANRVIGNDVSVDVLPAKNGEIELAFHNQQSASWQGSVGIDNNVSQAYHRWQLKSGLNLGNLFNLSDSLYLNINHSLHSFHKFTRSALLYYSVPYGYWTLNGFLSASQFKLPIPLETQQIQQRGRTLQWGLSGDYVIHRAANHISTISTQFERIDSKNRFDDAIIELQSPRLNSIQFGFNHLQLFEQSNLSFNVNWEKGWNQTSNQPESHYQKWHLDLQYVRYQQIGAQLFHHHHQLSGQYSHNYLPAVKQEDLIGRYRVRGFNDLSLSAEKNLVLQNTLSWIHTLDHWQISPYVALDLGVQKSTITQSNSTKALGYAIGLNANHPSYSLTLEWGTGRLYSDECIQQERSIFTSFSYKF